MRLSIALAIALATIAFPGGPAQFAASRSAVLSPWNRVDPTRGLARAALIVQVLDAPSGAPLPGSSISFNQLTWRGGSTDSTGRLVFPEVLEGDYSLSVAHKGYLGVNAKIRITTSNPESIIVRLAPGTAPTPGYVKDQYKK